MKSKLSLAMLLMVFIAFFCTIDNANAQVTIGSSVAPNAGSLLDLKQFPTDPLTLVNADKGLLLPRVNLKALDDLFPCASMAEATKHAGLIVFNMTEKDELCKGIYLWSGDEWIRLHGVCESMLATPAASYVMDGLDNSFPFQSGKPWTAEVLSDPDNILDQGKMVFSGVAGSVPFKLVTNVGTSIPANAAVIRFKDSAGGILDVLIKGEPVYLTLSVNNWQPGVDANSLTDIATTNSKRTIKSSVVQGTTWLSTNASNGITVVSNTTDASRTGSVKFSLDGIVGTAALEPAVEVQQNFMTISIEVHWVLKRLFGLDNELATPPAPQIIDLTSSWTWGGFYEHSIYGMQDVIPAGETTATFTILTNSKQPLVFGTPGASGTSLSWVDAAEVPELVERVDGISKYKMSLHAQELSGTAGRTGSIKLNISGGLEKELSVVQAQLEFLTLQNPAPSGDAYFFVGDDGGPATGGFTMNIADLKESPEIKYAYVNKHYLDYATYDQATNKFNVKLTENNPAEAPYPEFDHGLKEARFIVLYQIKATGRWQGGLVMLAQIPDDDSFNVEVTLPESGDEDAVEIVNLPEHVVNNVKVAVAEKDKLWLDVVVNEETNNLEIRSLELNLTGVDRVAEVMVSSIAKQRNGKMAETAYMKVKVAQEAIYLRSEEEVSGVGPDKGVYTITLTTNAAYKFVELEEIPASVDWLAAKIKVSVLGPISVETTTLKPNLTSVSRKHTIVIFIENKKTGEKIKREINFVQPPMTFTLSESSWNPHHDGDAKTFTMSTNSLQNITPSTDKDWLTTVMTDNGSGSFSLDLTATPNITGAQRTGTITLQIGASPVDGLTQVITVTQQPITLVLDPISWTSSADGESQAVIITTNSTKTVGATSDKTWLAIAGVSNTGLTLTTPQYTETADRMAVVKVTVNGVEKAIAVTQKAKNIILSVIPTSWNAPVIGGTQFLDITTNGANPTITIPVGATSWLSLKADGKTLEATPNITDAIRVADVLIESSGKQVVVAVTQSPITLKVTPSAWAVPAQGGTQTLNIVTNGGTPTIAIPAGATSWLSLDADGKTLVAKENVSSASRSANVVVKAGTKEVIVIVTQQILELSVDPSVWAAPVLGGKKTLNISTSSGSTPTITIEAGATSWLSLDADGKTLVAKENATATARTGKAIVKVGSKSVTVTVTQDPLSLTVDPTSWSAPMDGGSKVILATANHGTIAMTSNATSWLTVGADKKTITATANTGSSRTGVITVTTGKMSKTVTVTQDAIKLTVDPTSWVAPADGGSRVIAITNNYGTIAITSNATSWLTVGADKKTITTTANATAASRTGKVTVSNGKLTETVTVTQVAMSLIVDPTSWVAPVGGGSLVITTTANHGAINMTSSVSDWLTVGTDKKTIKALKNNTGSARSATVTVTTGKMSKTVTVTQDPIKLDVSPEAWNAPTGGGSQVIAITSNYGTVAVELGTAPGWLTIGADKKTLTATANTSTLTRSHSVRVSNGVITKYVKVQQSPMTLDVAPTSWTAPVGGGSQVITATSNYGTIAMTSNAITWLTVGTDKKTITASGNSTTATRTGIITVSNGSISKTVSVTQKPLTLSVSPTTWAAPVRGGKQRLTITTNGATPTITIPAAAQSWLSVDTDGQTLVAKYNQTEPARSTSVTVKSGTKTASVNVTQEQVVFKVTPSPWNVPLEGGLTQKFEVTTNLNTPSNTAWKPKFSSFASSSSESSDKWLLSGASGSVWAPYKNKTQSVRKEKYTITVGDRSLVVDIIQPVKQCPATMTDTDGNVYNVVSVGGECWMASNLYTTQKKGGGAFSAGSAMLNPASAWDNNAIPVGVKALSTTLKVSYRESTATGTAKNITQTHKDFAKKFGLLYNWSQANQACPAGWHLPTPKNEDDIRYGQRITEGPNANTSTTLRGNRNYFYYSADNRGPYKWGGKDNISFKSTGFNVLPAGFITDATPAKGNDFGRSGYIWVNDVVNNKFYHAWMFREEATFASRQVHTLATANKTYFSVRCVKD